MQSILHGNHLPMWIHDRKTLRFLEVSEGAIRQYGYSREEFRTMTIRDLRPAAEQCRIDQLDALDIEPDDIDPGRLRMHMRKDQTLFPVRVYANPMLYDGQPARLVVAKNVSQQLGLYVESASLDDRDWTLGLPNRRELEQRAQQSLDQADRTRRRVAVVCLHLDNLDQVTDVWGVEAANECLNLAAAYLTRRVRGMDTVARTGLKSFTVVLAELDHDFDLYRVAEALM